jgi:tRNA uridine 5-carboxymethylaminomethyl modification enzyme
MFTSRAEFRLRLRQDNADQRLTPQGMQLGCIGSERARAFEAKTARLDGARAVLLGLQATPNELRDRGIAINLDGARRNALDLLAYPGVSLTGLAAIWPMIESLDLETRAQLEIEGAYSGYLKRQEDDVRAFRRDEELRLPEGLNFDAIASLSAEVREKLKASRPPTLGAAGRIAGVTPAALTVLLRHVRRRDKRPAA